MKTGVKLQRDVHEQHVHQEHNRNECNNHDAPLCLVVLAWVAAKRACRNTLDTSCAIQDAPKKSGRDCSGNQGETGVLGRVRPGWHDEVG